jgi:hypothetical protein
MQEKSDTVHGVRYIYAGDDQGAAGPQAACNGVQEAIDGVEEHNRALGENDIM